MGKMSFKYSPSAVGTYENCPRKFKLRYIDKVESASMPKCVIDGIFLHSCFESYYKELKDLKELTPHVLNNALSAIPDIAHENFNEDITNFLEFNQRVLSHSKDKSCLKPLASEEKLYDESLNLVGIIDSIFTDGENFLLLDFKTGKVKDKINANYKFQLCVYTHLWNLFYPEQKITHWGLLFTKGKISNKNPIIEEVNHEEMQEMYDKLDEVKRNIEMQQFHRCDNSWNCKRCEFAKYCFGLEDDKNA